MKRSQFRQLMTVLTEIRDEMRAGRSSASDRTGQTRRSAAPKREVSLSAAVRRVRSECVAQGVPEAAFAMRTLQRMEEGKAPQRAGYTAEMRNSWLAFNTWLEKYIREEKSRLNWNHAVSYREDWQEHNA